MIKGGYSDMSPKQTETYYALVDLGWEMYNLNEDGVIMIKNRETKKCAFVLIDGSFVEAEI